ncbi:hypothetical protein B0H34DRAFT_756329 [Crassisporium funariophilum]|nr:hypothetical protein B0H34DRAFT_756329 [Crassisporium funariophilum]
MGEDLERQVFGGSDSELSSDEDDDVQQQQQQQPKLPPAPPRAAVKQRDEYESSGADSEDDYVQERPSLAKVKKRSSVGRKATEDGERKTAQKKRKRKPAPEIDLNDLPPEQANKIRLDMQIDEILRSKKGNRPRKKKANEEVLDSVADDEVARLRENMLAAADEDVRSNGEKLPATAKLRQLPEAMETLRKASLAQSMIDNNLLEAVRRWLEPLPDRSLPALNIQREFFNIIRKMEFIDSAVLKESGLFYTKCKHVTPDITRIANTSSP